MELRFEQADTRHIDEIVPFVREEDIREFERASGLSVEIALHTSFRTAKKMFAGYIDDRIVLLAGVCDLDDKPGIGIPWMVATPELEMARIPFLKACKPKVEELMEGYSMLYNYVDADNKTAIQWLKWLGFSILEPCNYGVSNSMFHPFIKEAEINV